MSVSHDIVLARVHARGHVRDSIASRHWLDRALAGVTDQLPGVPPGATLLVRRLRHLSPPPGRRIGPGSPALDRWRAGVRASLSDAAATAARPARGPVGAGAQAVLFADQSELLASLATDWLDGVIVDRWWWRSLLGTGLGAGGVVAAWAARACAAPAALDRLAGGRRHIDFAHRLGPVAARTLTRAIARDYGLAWPPVAAVARRGATPASPPWARVVADVPAARLAREEELLLGLGLMLSRTPALAVSADTVNRLACWLEAAPSRDDDAGEGGGDGARRESREPAPADDAPLFAEPQLTGETPGGAAGDLARTVDSEGAEFAGRGLLDVRSGGSAQPRQALSGATKQASAPRQGVDAGGGQISGGASAFEAVESDQPPSRGTSMVHGRERAGRRSGASRRVTDLLKPADTDRGRLSTAADVSPVSGEDRPNELAPAPGRSRLRDARLHSPSERDIQPEDSRSVGAPSDVLSSVYADTVYTELGGIFYLVNVAIHLGHYGDFTTPAEPGLTLSPWDWAALVGRHLLPRARRREAVWEMLAWLAGRTVDTPPGEAFRVPSTWRMPAEWLEPFSPTSRPWVIRRSGGRLVLRHPSGFPVLDRPLGRESEAVLVRELRRHRPSPRTREERAPAARGSTMRDWGGVSPALARWVGWTAEYVAARVQLALGSATPAAAARTLLRRRAVIAAGPERVDLRFWLDDHPVAIRRAGLDRDPGFVPAAGRVIAFHFD